MPCPGTCLARLPSSIVHARIEDADPTGFVHASFICSSKDGRRNRFFDLHRPPAPPHTATPTRTPTQCSMMYTYVSDPTYPAFPVFAFLGFVISFVPLSWHLQAWNAGTCLYMLWTGLACLNLFVNSIVWHGNAINWAPVWCDISSRIIIGTAVAIPAASLCINRRLYKIATIQTAALSSKAQKRRMVMEDLAIGLGIPLVEMALQYIPSGHRFNIYEDIGCFPVTYNTWPAYPLVLLWPMIIGLVSAVYCCLSLRAFFRRRADFREFITSSSALTVNRYFRLMALATTEILCTVPISVYSTYLNLTSGPLEPWINWANVHFNWSFVGQYPSLVWRSDPNLVNSLELSRWIVPVCAVVFFAFFGFAEEARIQYMRVASRFGFKFTSLVKVRPSNPPPRFGSGGTLPVFVTKGDYPLDSSFCTEKGSPTALSCSSQSTPPTSPLDQTPPPYPTHNIPVAEFEHHYPYAPAMPSTSASVRSVAEEYRHVVALPQFSGSPRQRGDDESSFTASIHAHFDELQRRSH